MPLVDKPDHPLVGVACVTCNDVFAPGDEVVEASDRYVHAACVRGLDLEAISGNARALLFALVIFVWRTACTCEPGLPCPPCRARAFRVRYNAKARRLGKWPEANIDAVDAECRRLGLGERSRRRAG